MKHKHQHVVTTLAVVVSLSLPLGCSGERASNDSDQHNNALVLSDGEQQSADAIEELEKEIARLAAENNRLRQIPSGSGSGHLATGPTLSVRGTGRGSLLEQLARLEITLRQQEEALVTYENQLAMAIAEKEKTARTLRATRGDLEAIGNERERRLIALQELQVAREQLAEARRDREAMNIRRLRIERTLYELMQSVIAIDPSDLGALQRLQDQVRNLSTPTEPPDFTATGTNAQIGSTIQPMSRSTYTGAQQ